MGVVATTPRKCSITKKSRSTFEGIFTPPKSTVLCCDCVNTPHPRCLFTHNNCEVFFFNVCVCVLCDGSDVEVWQQVNCFFTF